ncbi:MAG: metalloregulator ArsR/SmtB family transcription factor [Planctomycetes bacterium]|nr:metalloregulator ArsR/SmtB family transcription factor [Planctomycetota bacterium]
MTDLLHLQTTLKLLSDPTRLRLLALLSIEELAVQELVAITGLAQSRVSNHLALLKRAELVLDRREGSWAFYRLAPPATGGALTPELFEATIRPFLDSEPGRRDHKALDAVREQRRERSRVTHDALAHRWADVGQEFRNGNLRAEACAALLPHGMTVADLGCGAGYLTAYLARRGMRVIAVDHSERMLDAARQRLADSGAELRLGELEQLPLRDGEVDAAFANLAWHHVADMDRAADEMLRVLRPGGSAVITELLPHDEDWMREAMGDYRLGLRPGDVMGALARAGFTDLAIEELEAQYMVHSPRGEDAALPMFLVRGRRPDLSFSISPQPDPQEEPR